MKLPPSSLSLIARLTGVSHRYGDVAALDNVDLEIPVGSMVGFVGPDGVGKSTLLGLISGVRKFQAGKLEVLGGNMASHRHRAAISPRVAYMPQGLGRNLYSALSVFENIDFFGRLFGYSKNERASRINELVSSTGLAEFTDRPAGKLSGGMKQKLGLCCLGNIPESNVFTPVYFPLNLTRIRHEMRQGFQQHALSGTIRTNDC